METKQQYAWNVWHMVAMFFMTIALVCCVKLPTVQSLAEEVTPIPTPNIKTIDGKKYYEIGTAAELYWFAGLVNGTLKDVEQDPSANAVLTKDIDLNKSMAKVDLTSIDTTDGKLLVDENISALWVEWIPIGKYNQDASENVNYSGTFDGQGHTISHLFINEDQQGKTENLEDVGPVYYPSDDERYLGFIGLGIDSTVKNLGIIDSYIRGYRHMGSIIASGGTIENCFSNSTIVSHFYTQKDLGESTDYYVGGIAPNSTVKNSYFTGTLYFDGKRDDYSIGGEKYAIGNKFKITNCFSTNNLVSFDGEYVGSSDYDVITKITEQITNEQLAHMLQESILNGEEYWSQGTDGYPVPAKGVLVQHDYQKDTSLSNCCCGKYKLEENLNEIWQSISEMKKEDIPVKKTEEDDKTYYQLDSVKDLYWFAGLVNGSKYVCRTYIDDSGKKFELLQDVCANAILIKDITINEQVVQEDGKTLVETASNLVPWIPIGQNDITYSTEYGTKVLKNLAYMGIFDGNGYTISGLYWPYENFENVGFFGVITREGDNDPCGTIKNITIKDSYFIGGAESSVSVGGICGSNNGKIENCYSNAFVSSNSGGLVDNNYNSIARSYYAGKSEYAISYTEGTISYCVSDTGLIAKRHGTDTIEESFSGSNGTYSYVDTRNTGDVNNTFIFKDLKIISENPKESGVLTYILNKGVSEDIEGTENTEGIELRWYQTIGSDSEPVLDSTHSIVYGGQLAENAPLHCWNISEEQETHVYGTEGSSQYYCKYCYEVNKDAEITIDESNTTTLIKDETWQINSKDALIAFATYINHYYKEPTYQDAVLLCDIDLNDNTFMKNVNFSEVSVGSDSTNTDTYRKLIDSTGAIDTSDWFEWTPIGTSANKYKGTFDGQGYEIQHVYINGSFEESTIVEQAYMGLFSACTSGAVIKNLGIKDSYITGYRCASISATAGTIQNCYSNAILVGGAQYTLACAGIGLSASKFSNVNTWQDYKVNVSNSYFTGNMYGNYIDYLYPISYPSDAAKNCYFSEKESLLGDEFIADSFKNSTYIDSEEITNGRLLHRLQDYTRSNEFWNEGEKGYPVPRANTNDDKDVSGAHEYTNGICYCGKSKEDVDLEPYFTEQPDYDESSCVYKISNEKQLYWFAGLVNGDYRVCDGEKVKQNTKANAVLTANITVNQKVLDSGILKEDSSDLISWIPIGNSKYEGTFDGQKYTISGLYCEADGDVGFFKQVSGNAKIQNVTIEDSYFKGSCVGGICGLFSSGTIEGCSTKVTMTSSDTIGGICGWFSSGTIKDCSSEATVTGSSNVGGICGYSDQGTIQDCSSKATATVTGSNNVGGICGLFSSGTIEGCSSEATVTGSMSNVGGICGQVGSSTIKGCSSKATVKGNNNVGGICGLLDSESTMERCFSRGTVTGSGNYVGGICGKYSYTYNTSNTMKGCFSEATVTGSCVGGICGYNGGHTITQCYYKGKIISSTNTTNVGGIVGQNHGVGGVTYSISNCNFSIIGESTSYSSNNISIKDNIATEQTFNLPQEFTSFFKKNVNNARVLETSGALTYFLNKCQNPNSSSSDIYWYQKLTGENADSQPVLGIIKNDDASFVYAGQLSPIKYGFSNRADCLADKYAHEYDSDACTYCGLARAEVVGYTVKLEDGKIGLNFHMILNDTSLEKNCYMKFTWGSDEKTKETILSINVDSITTETIDKTTYYIFPCEVAAKEMADTITAEFYLENGDNDILLVKDEYSVQEYAKKIIESDAYTSEAKSLVKVMLNYGAYAQQYFGYNTEKLANVGITFTDDEGIATKDQVLNALSLEKYDFTPPADSTFIKHIGSSLLLLSDTTMRIYFELLGDTEIGNVTFTGETGSVNDGEYYYADAIGIKPNSLNKNISIVATLSETDSYTVTINPMYYVREMLEKETTEEKLSNLLCALYSYHTETVDYLGSINNSSNQ